MRLAGILKIMGFWSMVFLFTLGSIPTVLAENNDDALNGTYIGLTFLYNSIGGDFNGEDYFDSGQELLFIPKVKSNYGFGVSVGRRVPFNKNLGLASELGYYRSTHDYTLLEVEGGEAIFNMLTLNARLYFSANKAIQPFINSEVAWAWLIAKDCSITTIEPIRTGNASFSGLVLGVGGGIAYYIHPKVSIDAGIIFRFFMCGNAKGVLRETHDIESLLGISPNIILGIRYTFNSARD